MKARILCSEMFTITAFGDVKMFDRELLALLSSINKKKQHTQTLKAIPTLKAAMYIIREQTKNRKSRQSTSRLKRNDFTNIDSIIDTNGWALTHIFFSRFLSSFNSNVFNIQLIIDFN